MKKRNAIILLLVLLAIGAVLVWSLWDFSPPEADDSSRGPSRVNVSHSDDLHPGAAGQPRTGTAPGVNMLASRPMEPKERWTASLSFYIMDSVGKLPVKGAKVSVEGTLALPPAWSNADGNVTFVQLPPGMYWYSVFHDTFAGDDTPMESFFVLKASEHREILIELKPACVATGRVLDATGEAIANAEIYAERYEPIQPAITGADGRFQLSTGYLDHTELYVKASGFAPLYVHRGCAGGRVDLGDLMLVTGWTLQGQVVDPEGEPLAGVTVRDFPLEPGAPPRANVIQVTTDGSGFFAMPGLPFTDESIMFYKEGYRSATEHVHPAKNDITVTMQPECVLTGRVMDGDQNPLEGATIAAMQRKGSLYATSNAEGEFRLGGLGGNMSMLFVSWGEEGQQNTQMLTVRCTEQTDPLEIVFQQNSSVMAAGTVVDAEGSPAPFVMVWLAGTKRGGGGMPANTSTMTDENGAFSLAAPEEDTYTLMAVDMRSMRQGYAANLNGEQRDVEIRLSKTSRGMEAPMTGTVQDGEGNAISDFRYCWRHECPAMTPAEDDGTWRGTPGRDMFPLTVLTADDRMGILEKALQPTGGDASASSAVVTIGPGAALRGSLGTGFANGFAWLLLRGRHRTLQRISVQDSFDFPLLPPGRYYLNIVSSDGRRLDLPPIDIADGEDTDLGTVDLP